MVCPCTTYVVHAMQDGTDSTIVLHSSGANIWENTNNSIVGGPGLWTLVLFSGSPAATLYTSTHTCPPEFTRNGITWTILSGTATLISVVCTKTTTPKHFWYRLTACDGTLGDWWCKANFMPDNTLFTVYDGTRQKCFEGNASQLSETNPPSADTQIIAPTEVFDCFTSPCPVGSGSGSQAGVCITTYRATFSCDSGFTSAPVHVSTVCGVADPTADGQWHSDEFTLLNSTDCSLVCRIAVPSCSSDSDCATALMPALPPDLAWSLCCEIGSTGSSSTGSGSAPVKYCYYPITLTYTCDPAGGPGTFGKIEQGNPGDVRCLPLQPDGSDPVNTSWTVDSNDAGVCNLKIYVRHGTCATGACNSWPSFSNFPTDDAGLRQQCNCSGSGPTGSGSSPVIGSNPGSGSSIEVGSGCWYPLTVCDSGDLTNYYVTCDEYAAAGEVGLHTWQAATGICYFVGTGPISGSAVNSLPPGAVVMSFGPQNRRGGCGDCNVSPPSGSGPCYAAFVSTYKCADNSLSPPVPTKPATACNSKFGATALDIWRPVETISGGCIYHYVTAAGTCPSCTPVSTPPAVPPYLYQGAACCPAAGSGPVVNKGNGPAGGPGGNPGGPGAPNAGAPPNDPSNGPGAGGAPGGGQCPTPVGVYDTPVGTQDATITASSEEVTIPGTDNIPLVLVDALGNRTIAMWDGYTSVIAAEWGWSGTWTGGGIVWQIGGSGSGVPTRTWSNQSCPQTGSGSASALATTAVVAVECPTPLGGYDSNGGLQNAFVTTDGSGNVWFTNSYGVKVQGAWYAPGALTVLQWNVTGRWLNGMIYWSDNTTWSNQYCAPSFGSGISGSGTESIWTGAGSAPAELGTGSGVYGLIAHWMASSVSGTASGGTVLSLTDMTGNDLNANATSSATAPTMTGDILNGQPTLQFTGPSQQLEVLYPFTNPYTIFLVAAAQSDGSVLSAADGNWLLGYGDGGMDLMYAGGWLFNPGIAADGQFHIYAATCDGTTTTFYRSNLRLASAALTAAPTSLVFGGNGNSQFAEAMMFSRVLTSTELAQVVAQLQTKYGIS